MDLNVHSSQLLSKIGRPALPSTVLHRSGLLSTLQNELTITEAETFRHKLLLLCAPSGYGKTTLLVDFAQQTPIPCCWYMLAQADSDPIVFLRLLIASIRQRFPHFGANLEGVLADTISPEIARLPHGADIGHILDAITTAIETDISERFVLILCNYHEIADSAQINQVVDRLLQRLPAYGMMIIESRSIPPLNLSSLLARRQAIGLGSAHFRLSPEEIQQLANVQDVTPLTAEEAEYLANTFEGWITGILLGTRLGDMHLLQLTESNQPQSTRRPTRSNESVVPIHQQHLFSYLVNDVFSREPEVYAFLREAAILQQMTPQLCDYLLEQENALERLTYLERHGLFVSRAGEARQMVFTCHPVLRELLCGELRRTHPARFDALQRRAARFFQQSQDYEQAVYHAQQSGDEELAAQLISEAYWSTVSQGGLNTLERWLDRISRETLRHYPRLLVARATLSLARGEQGEVMLLLDEAEHVVTQGCAGLGADEKSAVSVEIMLARSKILFLGSQYAQAQMLCQQALEQLPIDNVRLRSEAHLRLGMCMIQQGDINEGIRALQQALQLSGRDTLSRLTARLHSQLANAYHMIGNHALSEHHRARAIHCWEALQDEQGKIKNLIAMGIVFQRRGSFEEAETTLMQALQGARNTRGFQQGEAYALASLGDLYQDQERYDQALIAIEDGLKLARLLTDRYLIAYSLCSLATTYLLMGDSATAQLILEELNGANEHLRNRGKERSFYDLTRGTVIFYLHRYDEAILQLTEVEQTMSQIGFQREQLECLLRLAGCYCALQHFSEMQHCLEKAVQIATHLGYEQLIKIELKRIPQLLQSLQTRPELAPVRTAIAQAIELPPGEGSGALLAAPTGPEEERPVSPEMPVSSVVVDPPARKKPVCSRGRVQVRSLGEPVVLVDEQPVTRWRMARAMEICFFLLDRGEPVHKEQMIEMFWPDGEDEEQIDQKFRSTIYYLRKALGDGCITARSGYYALNLEAVYGIVDYDVDTFQQAEQRAKKALAEHDDEIAVEAFSKMVELYRGDYVQSFYSDWCSFRRDELRRQYMEARHQLARIAWRQERWDESAQHWQHMLVIDNCMEEAHYGLMRCYMRQGKRGLALRQYQSCVAALRDEMGLTPGASLQRLYQTLTEAGQGTVANAR